MALSQDFINILDGMMSRSERDALLAALEREPEVSIRFNDKVADAERMVLSSLECNAAGRVPWMESAVYLDHRPQFTMDPLLHQGCYYVQEASSMFLSQAIRKCVSGPVHVLDLCAAPGGKSTHIAARLADALGTTVRIAFTEDARVPEYLRTAGRIWRRAIISMVSASILIIFA